ncbi:MAG: phosphotransferase [Candidatus Yanofskybacteria bacterium]|nr:phosphotransferase [Candidatus Yanofskybacteria bacterium]
MDNIYVFKPNNHSKWQISWNPVSSAVVEEIKKVLLEGYGLFDTVEVCQVDEWEKMSNNFKIILATENGFKKFLLRKNIVIKSEHNLDMMEKLSSFLRQDGEIPTPRIIKTSNESFFFHYQGFFYQLFEFIGGDHFRGTKEELADFAENLAHVHTALSHFPFAEEMKILKSAILMPWNAAGWKEIFSCCQRKSTEIDLAVVSAQDLILKASACAKIDSSKNTRKQVIKGDQHPLNTLYENNKLTALLDFADAEFGELVKDIGNACHRFVRQFVVFREGDWQKTLPLGLEVFFNHYQSINPLTEEEKLSVPSAILDGLLQKIYTRLYFYYMTTESEKYDDIAEVRKLLGLLKEACIINEYIAKKI